jgi:O-antigen/teichoic acid export membrane protein
LSLALTLVTIAAQTADLGIAITVASRIARETQAAAGTILSTGLVVRTTFALTAMAALIVAAVAGFFGDSGGVVAVAAIATPLSAASVLTAGSTARFRPEVASMLTLIQGVLWFIAVVTVGRTGSMMAIAACFVVVTLLQTGIGVAINRRVVPLSRPSMLEARRILAVSWPLAISALAMTAYYRTDSVILFQTRGASELGYYAAAFKFIDVAQLAPGILIAPLLPMAATSAAMDAMRRRLVLSLATRAAAVIGAGTAVVLIALAPQLIDLIFGVSFEPAVRPLVVLALAFMWLPLGFVGTTICSARGAVRPVAAICVGVAVVNVIGLALVCPRWGATGAAAVTAGTQFLVGAATCLLAARAMKAPLPLRELASLVAITAGTLTAMSLVPLPWPAKSLLTVTVFVVAVFGFRIITVNDFKRVLSRNTL